MAGKSMMIKKIIESRDEVYNVQFSRIIFCVPGESINLHHEYLDSLKSLCPPGLLQIHEGVPDLNGN